MRIHILTVGEPKLDYAKRGWQEYTNRLKHYHTLRLTPVADKYAYDAGYLLQKTTGAYCVALTIGAKQLTSEQLAQFLQTKAIEAQEVCFMIGGPNGLPEAVIAQADMQLGLSELTFPHDLAMVILAETLYRSSTITAGHPYHR